MSYKIKLTKNKEKRIIKDAIGHLNGYVLLLEKGHNIPALAVRENIKELKKIK